MGVGSQIHALYDNGGNSLKYGCSEEGARNAGGEDRPGEIAAPGSSDGANFHRRPDSRLAGRRNEWCGSLENILASGPRVEGRFLGTWLLACSASSPPHSCAH